MGISLKRAFKVSFAEKDSWKKVFIPALIVFVLTGLQGSFEKAPVIAAIFALLVLFFQILVNGFIITSGHNEIKNEEKILPEWDITRFLFVGFCSVFISLAYGVMLLPVIGIIAVLAFTAKAWSLVIGIPAVILVILFSSIPAMMYADNFKIGDAFNFSKLFALIKFGWKDYLILLGWSFLTGLILGFPMGILGELVKLFAGKAWASAISGVTYNIFIGLVGVNLSAQTYKNIIPKLPSDLESEQDGT